MNTRNTLPVEVEWKAAGGAGELEGYASVFGNVDQVGDVVLPGAFHKTIADWRRASQPMPLIADHDLSTNGVIGSIKDLAERKAGLWFKAGFSRSDKAQRIRQDVLDGHLRGTSFTYEVIRSSPGRGSVAGKAVARFLDELRLFEVTLSPFPVNELAGVTAAKASTAAWDGSASRFTPEQWRRSCLIDTGEGETDSKGRYKLPVREPGGALNVNAVHAAAAVLAGGRGGVDAPPDQRKAAARKLIRLYGEIGEEAPDGLRSMAGMGAAAFTGWLDSMGHAIGITDPFARKAAIDELVRGYTDLDDLAADRGQTPVTADGAATDGTSYPGPPDGAPNGQPPSKALPATTLAYGPAFLSRQDPGTSPAAPSAPSGVIAGVDAERDRAEIAALETEITSALEG